MAFLKRLTVHKYVKNHAIHRSKNSFIRDDDRATRLRFILRNIFLLLRIYHSERVNYLKEKKKKKKRDSHLIAKRSTAEIRLLTTLRNAEHNRHLCARNDAHNAYSVFPSLAAFFSSSRLTFSWK